MTGLPPEPNSFKIKDKIKCIINIDSSTMQIFYWFLYCLNSLINDFYAKKIFSL
jgi:hypothetical protein